MTMKQDNTKQWNALQSGSLRELVDQANSIGIQKEDFIQVLADDNGYFLLYYK